MVISVYVFGNTPVQLKDLAAPEIDSLNLQPTNPPIPAQSNIERILEKVVRPEPRLEIRQANRCRARWFFRS